MGKLFTAHFQDGTERFAADFSIGRARAFYDLTRLLETYLELPGGITPDAGMDEYIIHAEQFFEFFERFWQAGWLGDSRSGLFHDWARFAAGMIENIALAPRQWTDRNGTALEVQRCMRPEELNQSG